jgi:hypothetical protein
MPDNIAGSIREVNPKGGTRNCVNCAIATDAMLAGRAACALPGGPAHLGVLEKQFKRKFEKVASKRELDRTMRAAGPGSMQEARRLAEHYLITICSSTDPAIVDEQTLETDFGWVFFWNSRQFRETGEFQYALAGNAPLIVDRRDGSVRETSTAEPIEEIIEKYRRIHAAVH